MKKTRRDSQQTIVLKHLCVNNSITTMEAFVNYHITRLAALIFNLRKEGYDIDTEIVNNKSPDGSYTRYAKYSLVGG